MQCIVPLACLQWRVDRSHRPIANRGGLETNTDLCVGASMVRFLRDTAEFLANERAQKGAT